MSVFADVFPDIGQIGPIGGIAALFIVMLRMVWSDNANRRLIEGQLRTEFATEKAALITYNEEALRGMQSQCLLTTDALRRVHSDELASLNRRIDALEGEVKGLRGPR